MSSVQLLRLDLDAPPSSRWNAIVPAYREQLRRVVNELYSTFGDAALEAGGASPNDDGDARAFAQQLAMALRDQLESLGFREGFDDIVAIARLANLPIEDIALLHLAYESVDDAVAGRAAGCTTLVAASSASSGNDDAPLLARTLDWDIPGMRELCVDFSVWRGGVEIAKATSFVGYAGILTALRLPTAAAAAQSSGFGFAINYRATPPPLAAAALASHAADLGGAPAEDGSEARLGAATPAFPIGFLARFALQTCATFTEAVAVFRTEALWAPCYVILVGAGPAEHVVLARSERSVDDACAVGGAAAAAAASAGSGSDATTLVLVQANADHGDVAALESERLVAIGSAETFEAKRERWMREVGGVVAGEGEASDDDDDAAAEADTMEVVRAIVAESATRVRAAEWLWGLSGAPSASDALPAARLRCTLENASISDESTIHGTILAVAPLRYESWIHRCGTTGAQSAPARGGAAGDRCDKENDGASAAPASVGPQRRCACS